MGCSFMTVCVSFPDWRTNRKILNREVDFDVAIACFKACMQRLREDISFYFLLIVSHPCNTEPDLQQFYYLEAPSREEWWDHDIQVPEGIKSLYERVKDIRIIVLMFSQDQLLSAILEGDLADNFIFDDDVRG